jgi:hypothetical protein
MENRRCSAQDAVSSSLIPDLSQREGESHAAILKIRATGIDGGTHGTGGRKEPGERGGRVETPHAISYPINTPTPASPATHDLNNKETKQQSRQYFVPVLFN